MQLTYIPLLLPASIIPEYSFCASSLSSLKKVPAIPHNKPWQYCLVFFGGGGGGGCLEIPPVICIQVNAARRKIAVGFWYVDIPD